MTFDSAAVSGGETIVVCECAFFSFPAMLLNALMSGGCCVAWTAMVSAATAAASAGAIRVIREPSRPSTGARRLRTSGEASRGPERVGVEQRPVEHDDSRLAQVANPRGRIAVNERKVGS